jgi:hypothetical protein
VTKTKLVANEFIYFPSLKTTSQIKSSTFLYQKKSSTFIYFPNLITTFQIIKSTTFIYLSILITTSQISQILVTRTIAKPKNRVYKNHCKTQNPCFNNQNEKTSIFNDITNIQKLMVNNECNKKNHETF